MGDIEAGGKVLEILKKEGEPVQPDALFAKLGDLKIGEFQGGRLLVELAVEHKVEITADRLFKLRK